MITQKHKASFMNSVDMTECSVKGLCNGWLVPFDESNYTPFFAMKIEK